MSNLVSLTIDGKEATVPAGTNLIDAAESVGIHIPNLCYLKGMKGMGACRLCLIEVEGGRGPVAGCITKVKEGMAVKTITDDIEKTRKFIIDLIVSMHPMDCMTCTKAGVCNLQEYAYNFEIKESTFSRKSFGYPVDEANPFIKRDSDYCVLCGKCIRVCNEQGTNVLEFMGRGVGAKVSTAQDKPLQESQCTFCGSCVDVCPVNALLETDRWRKGREWEYEKTDSVCLSCGSGCDITVSANEGSVVKINSGGEDGSVEKYICAIGRFGFESTTSDVRVRTPLKKEGGKLVETSWDDALKTVADKLKAAGAKTGIISTASILNEDAAALSKLASDVIKTKNIDSSAGLYTDAEAMNNSDAIDIDSADVIITAGLNASQQDRVLAAVDAAVRKRAARGAKLIALSAAGSTAGATVSITGDEAASLSQIAKALVDSGSKGDKDLEAAVSGVTASEDAAKAAELITAGTSIVVLCAPSLFGAARNLSLITDATVAAVPFEANARGVVANGVTTGGKTYKEMSESGADVLYAVGDVPVSDKPKSGFIVAQTSYLTGLAEEADIVLPASSYLESEGTMINYLGRVKDVNDCVDPEGLSKQHKDIVADIAKAMGSEVTADTANAQEASKATFSPFEKKAGLDASPADLIAAVNTCALNHSKLVWLKEAKVAVK